MSKLIDFDLRPDRRTLRQFGFIALVGFGLLALLAWLETAIFALGLGEARTWVAATLGGIGLLSALLAVLAPAANRPLYVALTLIALPIGFVLSYVILGGLFYLVITPVGLLLRLTGRDPMGRRFLRGESSYWVDARPPRPKESYFKQF